MGLASSEPSRSGSEDGREASPAAAARALLRAADRATLATLRQADGAIWPYASLAMVATSPEARPLLLLSDLAEHSKNIAADGRVSLLIDGTQGLEEPLAGPRVTLLGTARESREPADRARYLARHPAAAAYAGMRDFRLYRIDIERGHLVGGFGRIHWVTGKDVLFDGAAARTLAASEADILAHLNADHRETLTRYAETLLGLRGEGWAAVGIDPEGLDLRQGGRVARLPFAATVTNAGEARAELVRLAIQTRKSG